MPRIEASVEIGRPCAEVFAFVKTPANAPRYDPAVLRHEPLDGRPLHLGSRVRLVARFVPGLQSTVISAVTDWQDSGETRRAVFATATGPLRTRGVHALQTTLAGTLYNWAMEWDETPGPLGVALNLLMRRMWPGNLQPPTRRPEASVGGAGGWPLTPSATPPVTVAHGHADGYHYA